MHRRRFTFNPPAPKTQPPGTVVPTLDHEGRMICPECCGACTTPVESNPYNEFHEEKMVLRRGEARCPHKDCYAVHWITDALALKHNAFWYPDDPQYALPDEEAD